ncbi:DUF177 domain-containing protein [Halocynthiibacter namhaensis]|uniref:DUF177 domain-containing protein n=1 Tax=Halocynthiibacter namhaensis TaxID=1290553 RepID=UPI00068E728F|nr:DUF177 domain-containing protein [Halocynthiibacter namhaensis]
MTDSNQDLPFSHSFETRSLKTSRDTVFKLQPNAEDCAAIATALGLLNLTKLRFDGKLSASGKRDWVLTAQLGATVEQACISTLVPVRSRIEETVVRRFVADYEAPDEGSETEMDPDETVDTLGSTIDVGDIMTEALALTLPAYPRSDAAAADTQPIQAAPKGITPLTDADLNPFSALLDLKNTLKNKDSDAE